MIIVLITLLFSTLYSDAAVSNNKNNSLSYSLSFFTDSETYYNENNENQKINDKLISAKFNYIVKGSYEISFLYLYNMNMINSYQLPFEGPYGFFSFNYHFKEKDRFPLNLSFGVKGGMRVKKYFKSQSYNLMVYKEFSNSNYPVIPFINLVNERYAYVDDQLKIYNTFSYPSMGFYIKLIVDNINNKPINDIIWINVNMSKIEKDIITGFNIGLFHPL